MKKSSLFHILTMLMVFTLLSGCTGSESEDSEVSDTIETPDETGNSSHESIQALSISSHGGTAPFTITVNGSESNLAVSGSVRSYTWDFGDGSTANTAVGNHTYTSAGEYTVTLTVIDSEGAEHTLSDTVHVYSAVDNSAATAPTDSVRLYDTFEYAVDRDPSNPIDVTGLDNPFVNQGGWTAVKAVNVTGGYHGYLYTVTEIPGYSGEFPGKDSNRVLAIEALPESMDGQTDFYLQYDNAAYDREAVPGNVWFQFWIYVNRYNDPTGQNDQLSVFHSRSKFIYPCNDSYPCQEYQLNWLNMLGYATSEPHWANEDPTKVFLNTIDPWNVSIDYQLAEEYNQFKLGQTDVSEYIKPNRWTLVKIHYDTSGPQGTYESWLKPLGGTEVKVAEWIGNVTADFTWPVADVGGHRAFRMPTTVDRRDYWIYLDDFVMAESEDDLPEYPY